jgi:hypothetical protein
MREYGLTLAAWTRCVLANAANDPLSSAAAMASAQPVADTRPQGLSLTALAQLRSGTPVMPGTQLQIPSKQDHMFALNVIGLG